MGQQLPSESSWVFAKIHIARPHPIPTESEVGREVGRTWLFFFFFALMHLRMPCSRPLEAAIH